MRSSLNRSQFVIGSYWNPRCLQKVITNCDNLVALFFRKLKHEILRETLGVSFHRLIERASIDSIQFRKMPVNHYLLTPKQEDALLDYFYRYQGWHAGLRIHLWRQ